MAKRNLKVGRGAITPFTARGDTGVQRICRPSFDLLADKREVGIDRFVPECTIVLQDVGSPAATGLRARHNRQAISDHTFGHAFANVYHMQNDDGTIRGYAENRIQFLGVSKGVIPDGDKAIYDEDANAHFTLAIKGLVTIVADRTKTHKLKRGTLLAIANEVCDLNYCGEKFATIGVRKAVPADIEHGRVIGVLVNHSPLHSNELQVLLTPGLRGVVPVGAPMLASVIMGNSQSEKEARLELEKMHDLLLRCDVFHEEDKQPSVPDLISLAAKAISIRSMNIDNMNISVDFEKVATTLTRGAEFLDSPYNGMLEEAVLAMVDVFSAAQAKYERLRYLEILYRIAAFSKNEQYTKHLETTEMRLLYNRYVHAYYKSRKTILSEIKDVHGDIPGFITEYVFERHVGIADYYVHTTGEYLNGVDPDYLAETETINDAFDGQRSDWLRNLDKKDASARRENLKNAYMGLLAKRAEAAGDLLRNRLRGLVFENTFDVVPDDDVDELEKHLLLQSDEYRDLTAEIYLDGEELKYTQQRAPGDDEEAKKAWIDRVTELQNGITKNTAAREKAAVAARQELLTDAKAQVTTMLEERKTEQETPMQEANDPFGLKETLISKETDANMGGMRRRTVRLQ